MRAITGIAALAGALLLAGCGAAHQATTAAAKAPAASTSPATPLTGDAKACRAMETRPAPQTQQQIDGYLSFLSRESLVATNPALQAATMNMNTGILGIMAGTVSTQDETKRWERVVALCAKTGGAK